MFSIKNNKKDSKFKVGDYVRISKYKSIFEKGNVPNWSDKVFVIGKVKNNLLWTNVISDLNGKEIAGTFYKKRITENKLRRI